MVGLFDRDRVDRDRTSSTKARPTRAALNETCEPEPLVEPPTVQASFSSRNLAKGCPSSAGARRRWPLSVARRRRALGMKVFSPPIITARYPNAASSPPNARGSTPAIAASSGAGTKGRHAPNDAPRRQAYDLVEFSRLAMILGPTEFELSAEHVPRHHRAPRAGRRNRDGNVFPEIQNNRRPGPLRIGDPEVARSCN